MSTISFEKEALFEHRFWLQILGDHGRFIHDALASSEAEKIQKSIYFIRSFDELLGESRKPLGEKQIHELTEKAFHNAQLIREFKLDILREQLIGKVKIDLPPTFFNHMINEVEEYLRILQLLLNKEILSTHPIYYHKLWLPDAAGHAGAIQCRLDDIEKDLREKSRGFVMLFNDLYLKADEFSGYLRTCIQDFPALHRLNSIVESEVLLFMQFLKEIEVLRISKKALGTLMPLIPDHMFREECYYLTKLSRISEVSAPDCDPTKPRI